MQKRLILGGPQLEITISRLCQQLIENHNNFERTVIMGLQPRGIYLAEKIKTYLGKALKTPIETGYLDTTFHRDDFRRRESPKLASATKVSFIIEDKSVILVDDVLYTGRSIRAALDAMITFGRPKDVELLVLVNRKYSRELPVEPKYVGSNVNTLDSQKVVVELQEQGYKSNKIWLVDK